MRITSIFTQRAVGVQDCLLREESLSEFYGFVAGESRGKMKNVVVVVVCNLSASLCLTLIHSLRMGSRSQKHAYTLHSQMRLRCCVPEPLNSSLRCVDVEHRDRPTLLSGDRLAHAQVAVAVAAMTTSASRRMSPSFVVLKYAQISTLCSIFAPCARVNLFRQLAAPTDHLCSYT